MHRILLVDDEPFITQALRRVLRKHYEIETAPGGNEGLVLLESFRPDVVISDFRMPGINGAEFLKQVKERSPLTLRILLSGHADLKAVIASINEGEICRFLSKPWDDAELIRIVQRMLHDREVLSALYSPFRTARSGLTAEASQSNSALSVSARLTGEPFAVDHAMAIISKFVGAMEEDKIKLLGGLLERQSGKITFVAEVGGDQRLNLELPVIDAPGQFEQRT